MGPAAANSSLARGAAAGLGAADAPTPGTVRTAAAGNLSTALAGPARPRTVAPNGAVEPPSKRATCKAGAFDELTMLRILDFERLADPLFGGRA